MKHQTNVFTPYLELIPKLRANNPAFDYMFRKYEDYQKQLASRKKGLDRARLEQDKNELEQEILVVLKQISS